MTKESSLDYAGVATEAHPQIRNIGPSDLWDVLVAGTKDFNAKPTHFILIAILYPIVGVFLINLTAGYDVLPLIFPLIAGFALIGPMAALGLYELSRRRELGLDDSLKHVFDVLHAPSIRAIVTLSLIMMVLYFAWLGAAMLIFELTVGSTAAPTFWAFARDIFSTAEGWTLIIVGCGVGFLFAVAVLATSVVSFPMLLDRNVTAATAIQTSFRAVMANPITMAMWGFIVAAGLVLGSLPFFFGLAIVMPILGHATWHLYRKVVEV